MIDALERHNRKLPTRDPCLFALQQHLLRGVRLSETIAMGLHVRHVDDGDSREIVPGQVLVEDELTEAVRVESLIEINDWQSGADKSSHVGYVFQRLLWDTMKGRDLAAFGLGVVEVLDPIIEVG